MAGFANRTIHLEFPELSEDWEVDPIWVVIRNPRTQSSDFMQPRDVPLGPDGRPLVAADAVKAMYDTISKLIIKWRMYDSTDDTIDDDGVAGDQRQLPQVSLAAPATPDMVRRLPTSVIARISTHMRTDAAPVAAPATSS